ncbi:MULTISPECIES: ABC transporter ATP-binding protein [Vibrio]|uniref:ABC transporter ATP-binding protein n=1 Tax=Vibrio TaxID=662 RepID=UPI000CC20793|nr:ABC transporter ATP-binding protein [Vibrio lentus]PMN68831.1 sugar ABC transporter ATP-binding protein [Vibrio lentus]
MIETVIEVNNVIKKYPLYHHIGSGIKNILLNPMKFISSFKTTSYVALNDVSFTVKKGESIALIGKNGAGKSTTLALLAGVLKPNQGSIRVKGRVASMLELGGGFHPDLTGRENIMLNAVLLGLTLEEVKVSMDSIIEFSELGDFIDQPIRTYSSGMLAKLGFSVITSIKPDVLLIDEVLAVGDFNFQRKCLEVIEDFKSKGVTIFLVSHNMNDVKAFCDKAIWIENSRLRAYLPVDDIIDDYLAS